jgi:hypothetical protein
LGVPAARSYLSQIIGGVAVMASVVFDWWERSA